MKKLFYTWALTTTLATVPLMAGKDDPWGIFGAFEEARYKNFTVHIKVKDPLLGETVTLSHDPDSTPYSHIYRLCIAAPDPKNQQLDQFTVLIAQRLYQAQILAPKAPGTFPQGMVIEFENAAFENCVPLFEEIQKGSVSKGPKKVVTFVFQKQFLDRGETETLFRLPPEALVFRDSGIDQNAKFLQSPLQRLYVSGIFKKVSTFLPVLPHLSKLTTLKISADGVWPKLAKILPKSLQHIVVQDTAIESVAGVFLPLAGLKVADKFKEIQRLQVKGKPEKAFSFLYVKDEKVTFEGFGQFPLSMPPSPGERDKFNEGISGFRASFLNAPIIFENFSRTTLSAALGPITRAALGNPTFVYTADDFNPLCMLDQITAKILDVGSASFCPKDHPDILFSPEEWRAKILLWEGRQIESLEEVNIADFFCHQEILDRAKKVAELMQ